MCHSSDVEKSMMYQTWIMVAPIRWLVFWVCFLLPSITVSPIFLVSPMLVVSPLLPLCAVFISERSMFDRRFYSRGKFGEEESDYSCFLKKYLMLKSTLVVDNDTTVHRCFCSNVFPCCDFCSDPSSRAIDV